MNNRQFVDKLKEYINQDLNFRMGDDSTMSKDKYVLISPRGRGYLIFAGIYLKSYRLINGQLGIFNSYLDPFTPEWIRPIEGEKEVVEKLIENHKIALMKMVLVK